MKRKAQQQDPVDWNKNLVYAIAARIYVDLLSSVIHEDKPPAGRKCIVGLHHEGDKTYVACTLQAWNYPSALSPLHFLLVERSLAQLPIERNGWAFSYKMWNFAEMDGCTGGFDVTFKLDRKRCKDELDLIDEDWNSKRIRCDSPEDQARRTQIVEVLNAINSCVCSDLASKK